MDPLLAELEPRLLWSYFLELSKIPRGSGDEAAAARWVAEQGRALGLEVEQDAVGNVLIRKPGTPGREDRPVVAMQAHVDMVCEKNEGTVHDFAKDPIRVRRDGDWLRATGTTLGADNGIGVAAGLAALASPDLAHPPLELLVTVDEETGLTGANALRPGWLRARYLLNLDSEEEGKLTVGCAGGIDTVATRALTPRPRPAGTAAWRLKVSGLKGGHSGGDIAAGRGNALRVLGQVLADVRTRFGLALADVRGGNKRNAIAREAWATVVGAPADEAALREAVAAQEAHWRAALGAFDPGLTIAVEPGDAASTMSDADADAVVGLLVVGPHGVEATSPDIPGLVQTSTNLGVARTHDGQVEITFLTRSAIEASKRALADRIVAACTLAGFTPRHEGGYPGWKPEPASPLVKLVDAAHVARFGKPLEVVAIHAGLECGLVGEKYPGLQMVSFGPDMADAHTPNERVSVPSVARFWAFLADVLAAF